MAKRQTRLAGLDDKILGLYAGGMSVRDIEAHLSDLYGVQIKRDTISRVTDSGGRARGGTADWRPSLGSPWHVKVRWSARSHPRLLPGDRRTVEGERDVIGIWWQETEGAKFWLAVLNDLHHRGV